MNTCSDCAKEPCRWFCPIHLVHHPVANMVDHCVEKATAPKPKSA